MAVLNDRQFSFLESGGRILKLVIILCLIFFFFSVVGMHSLLAIPMLLLLGWLSFLITVIPQIAWNWNAITFSIICVIGFMIGWHYLARWLRSSIRPNQPPWPWRWTIITSLAVFMVFFAAISVIGLIHQVTWLVTTKEPMTRQDYLYNHKSIMHSLQAATIYRNRNSDNPKQIRGADMRVEIAMALDQSRSPNVRILILSDDQDILTGAVIDFRETRLGKKHPFVCYRWDSQRQNMEEVAIEEDRVLEFISETENKLPLP